jgi:hypothetical protein
MRHIHAADGDGAGGRFLKPCDQAQQCRFAAAGGTDKNAELTFTNVEIDALDDIDGAE